MSDDDTEEFTVLPKRTVEEWAALHGDVPHMNGVRENPRFWRYAAARALSRWPVGFEATEAEYDAALNAAANAEVKS